MIKTPESCRKVPKFLGALGASPSSSSPLQPLGGADPRRWWWWLTCLGYCHSPWRHGYRVPGSLLKHGSIPATAFWEWTSKTSNGNNLSLFQINKYIKIKELCIFLLPYYILLRTQKVSLEKRNYNLTCQFLSIIWKLSNTWPKLYGTKLYNFEEKGLSHLAQCHAPSNWLVS